MAAAYPAPGPLVWKDPRACLLIPFWRELLPGPLTAVFVWRDPVEVARSLHARDGIPLEDGLALWEWYNRTIAAGLHGIDTFVVDYATVLERTQATIAELADWMRGLGRFDPWSESWDVTRAVASVHADLHHQSARIRTEEDGGLPSQSQITDWLRSSEGGHLPFVAGPPPPSSPWVDAVIRARRERSHLLRRLDQAQLDAAEYELAIQRLEAELGRAHQTIEGARLHMERLKASTSWKVTRPLRAAVSKVSRRSDD
jgi:hypothetical protein